MKAALFIKIAFFINKSKRALRFEFCCATVEVLHRTSKWGEVRRLACPLRRFPFAAPPNCEGKVVRSTKGGDGASRQTIDDRRGRDLRFEDVETIRQETSDGQTIRLQTGPPGLWGRFL